MAGNNEFGEFSSVSDGWGQQNNFAISFSPDWLACSDNQDWVTGVVPNNEQPAWNSTFPELPKELSNLLTNEIDPSELVTDLAVNNMSNGSVNPSNDEFGDFECSQGSGEVTMTSGSSIRAANMSTVVQSSIDTTSFVTANRNTQSTWTPSFNGEESYAVADEGDEFGDFEGTSISKQPLSVVEVPNIAVSDNQGLAENEFVSTAAVQPIADDDFGSFEAVEFVAAAPTHVASVVSTSVATPTIYGATPSSIVSPPSFSTVAESCFICDHTSSNTDLPVDCQPLSTLAEQSSLWPSLRSSLKTTSPLYSWSKSHIEDQYFTALKVDPMLVYTILSFAEEMGMAPLPHDQQLAINGFQWPDSPTEGKPEDAAATLLDLTLSSPIAAPHTMSRNDSFKLDEDLMGLDFTMSELPTTAASLGEELPTPATYDSKTADAIADILGLSTNPYLTSEDTSKKDLWPTSGTDNPLLNTSSTSDSLQGTNGLSLSQPLDTLIVSKEDLQSTLPSQKTLEALQVTPDPIAAAAENKPVSLSIATIELLNSLPDVIFMLSGTHK